MAVPTTNISMSAINAEQTGVDSTSLTALSTTGAITTGQDVATLDGSAPHGMNEFGGYVHTNLGSFPSLNNWTTFQTRTVIASGYFRAEAFAFITFRNLTGSNRIEVGYVAGTNASMATVYTDYIPYSGFTGDIKVRWTAPIFFPSGSFIANPYALAGTSWAYPQADSDGTLSPAYIRNTDYTIPTNGGYLQLKFFTETTNTGNSNQTAYMFMRDFQTQVSFVSNGTTYSALSAEKDIFLTARRGYIF